MFNTILTKFQGFFSRSFWFGNFLPVALVAIVHLALLELTRPALLPIESWIDAGIGQQTIEISLVLATLVVLAYVLGPFTPLLSDVLEGRILPGDIQKQLRDWRLTAWRNAEAQLNSSIDDFNFFEGIYSIRLQEIRNFHSDREQRHAHRGTPLFDMSLMRKAKRAVEKMEAEMSTTSLPDRTTVEDALEAIERAQRTCASTAPEEELTILDDARAKFQDLLWQALSEAEYRIGTANKSSFLRMDLMPTRVGDARRSVERYVQDTYGISDFDYIWTRVQMVLPSGDSAFQQGLKDAQSQVDFSVLILFLSLTIPAVWLPTCLYYGAWLELYIAIGVLTPLVVLFFFELVVQSHAVFSQAVKAAIDKYRLKVLTEIEHQPMPPTLAAERLLWEGLQLASGPGNSYDLVLQHGKDP